MARRAAQGFRRRDALLALPETDLAAVRGPCLAGAFELMLACDMTIASDTAFFGEPELKFGAGIVAMLLPWLVGPKIAKEIIFLGEDRIPAARARESASSTASSPTMRWRRDRDDRPSPRRRSTPACSS